MRAGVDGNTNIDMIKINREALYCFGNTGVPGAVIDGAVQVIHSTICQ
jgi:hypothetical protein